MKRELPPQDAAPMPAAHAACEYGMDAAAEPADRCAVAAWVAVVTVALAAVLFKHFLY